MFNLKLSLLGSCIALAACQGVAEDSAHAPTAPALHLQGSLSAVKNAQLLPPLAFVNNADRLQINETGLQLIDHAGQATAQLEGAFKTLDHRVDTYGLLVASLDRKRQQAFVVRLNQNRQWEAPHYLPSRAFAIEGLCLYRDDARNDYLFVVGEDGVGEQWLVAKEGRPVPELRKVRSLSLPPQSAYCQVNDDTASLFVNEEQVGVWRYDAGPDAPLVREPVDLRAPFGSLAQASAGMATLPNGLLLLDPKGAALRLYQQVDRQFKNAGVIELHGFDEPEQVSVRTNPKGLDVLIVDDDGAKQATIDWRPTDQPAAASIPGVAAVAQTQVVPSAGDAADDPAIWVNEHDPAQSRLLGTDKKGGLLSYDLAGKQLQDLRVGRLNNVDVRRGFQLGNERVDLAVASNRDRNSLHLFTINPISGDMKEMGEIATSLKEIYGLCMFKDRQGAMFAIVNDKDGTFQQYRLNGDQGTVVGQLVRGFRTASQPEGCVADDEAERLYIGEEKVAVWTLDARADASSALEQVIATNDVLRADIEGLAIYKGAKRDYLIISSQGDSSYVVVEAQAPYTFRGHFRISLNSDLNIDGTSETDGIEVTSSNLGGPWSKGMLVVQDGRKRLPQGNQNFKYVPWSAVADALALE